MSTVLEAVSDFWVNYNQWIGLALIPTLITGLASAPQTEKAAPWVRKAWDVLKVAMDFLSILTHKDKPGTFKLPLQLDAVIPKKKKVVVNEAPAEDEVVVDVEEPEVVVEKPAAGESVVVTVEVKTPEEPKGE